MDATGKNREFSLETTHSESRRKTITKARKNEITKEGSSCFVISFFRAFVMDFWHRFACSVLSPQAGNRSGITRHERTRQRFGLAEAPETRAAPRSDRAALGTVLRADGASGTQ